VTARFSREGGRAVGVRGRRVATGGQARHDAHVRTSGQRGPRYGDALALLLMSAVVAAGVVLAQTLTTGSLDPRRPSNPRVGVLAGAVDAGPPGAPAQEAVLRLTGPAGEYNVPVTREGTFAVELPPGVYTVAAGSGVGVCPPRVTVTADAWQRTSVLLPCEAGPVDRWEPPPLAAAPAPPR
jgi:hypothetical protein